MYLLLIYWLVPCKFHDTWLDNNKRRYCGHSNASQKGGWLVVPSRWYAIDQIFWDRDGQNLLPIPEPIFWSWLVKSWSLKQKFSRNFIFSGWSRKKGFIITFTYWNIGNKKIFFFSLVNHYWVMTISRFKLCKTKTQGNHEKQFQFQVFTCIFINVFRIEGYQIAGLLLKFLNAS